jgi:hypothetical protein
MKKLLFITFLCFVLISLKAQEAFQVPTLTDANKHSMMVFQTNGFVLNTINYAKSMGKTVEDVANFTGDQFKTSWNKENGFTGFVNGTLYNWLCFVTNNNIEILDQSNRMISFKTNTLFPDLKKNSTQFNVTYEDYLTFMRIVHEKVADYLGAVYSQTSTEDGMVITIKKK